MFYAHPVPHCRRRIDVLRQLPARQRAGRGADAPRPRRDAAALLHADADRRRERQPPAAACSSAASASTSSSSRRVPASRRHARSARGTPRRSSARSPAGSIAVDPKQLGALTVSTLRGVDGHQRKEIEKLLDLLRGRAAARCRQHSLHAADQPGGAAQARAAAAGRDDAAGRRPVSRGAAEPYRTEALELVRAQVADVDLFIAVSDYYARFMRDYLGIPESKDARRAARRQRGRSARSRRASGTGRSRSATSRASRRRRACTTWPTPIASCGARRACRRRACWSAGYLAAGTQAVPRRRSRAIARRGRTGRRVRVPRQRRPAEEGAVLPRHRRVVGAEPLSRAEGPVPARGDGVRRAGRAAQSWRVSRDDQAHRRRLAGAVGSRAPTSRTPCSSSGRMPIVSARLGRQGAEGVRKHYTVRHMAEAVLEAYEDARPLSAFRRSIRRLRASSRCCATCRSRSSRRSRVRDGTVGLRQEHAALHPRRPGAAVERHGPAGRQQSVHSRPTALAAFRNREVGFVLQDHCLLPQCTVLENVLVPTLVGAADPDAPARARSLLEQVGLAERLHHRPAELSGGEKQRAAIARALIRNPRLHALRRADRQSRRGHGGDRRRPAAATAGAAARDHGARHAQRNARRALPAAMDHAARRAVHVNNRRCGPVR